MTARQWCGVLAMIAACLPGAVAGCGTGLPPWHPRPAPQAPGARRPGTYVVTLVPGTSAAALASIYGRYGLRSVTALGHDRYQMVLRQDPGPEQVQALAAGDRRIQAVQPDFIYRATPAPGIQRFGAD